MKCVKVSALSKFGGMLYPILPIIEGLILCVVLQAAALARIKTHQLGGDPESGTAGSST